MTRLVFVALIVVALATAAAAKDYDGIDTSDHVVISDWDCLKSNGNSFGILRCWHSYGAPDSNCPHSLANGYAAGIKRLDVYMFPCESCGDGAGQVKSAVDYLNSYNSNWTMFWFDIEGPGQYWGSSTSSNQRFFEDMVNQAEKMHQKIGVYTSKSQWQPIMGDSYTGASKYPLWYAHYDNKKSFDDFEPFNGWTKPGMKQYMGDSSECSIDSDLNWTPYDKDEILRTVDDAGFLAEQ